MVLEIETVRLGSDQTKHDRTEVEENRYRRGESSVGGQNSRVQTEHKSEKQTCVNVS